MRGWFSGLALEVCCLLFLGVGLSLLTGLLSAMTVGLQPCFLRLFTALLILHVVVSLLESILHFCLLSFLNASLRSSYTSCFKLWGHMWFLHRHRCAWGRKGLTVVSHTAAGMLNSEMGRWGGVLVGQVRKAERQKDQQAISGSVDFHQP
jgi:hypothetical protein